MAKNSFADDFIFEMMETGNGLFDSVCDCNLTKTEILLNTGNVDVNEPDKFGRTVLFLSVCRGYFDITKLLIDNGADVKWKDQHGNGPLHWSGHPDIIELLVSRGADVKARNVVGLRPKDMAKRRGLQTDVIKVFERLEKQSGQEDKGVEQYESLFQEFSSEIGMKNLVFLLLGICFLSLYFAYFITDSSRRLEMNEPVVIEKHFTSS